MSPAPTTTPTLRPPPIPPAAARGLALLCVFGGLALAAYLDRRKVDVLGADGDAAIELVDATAAAGIELRHRVSPLDPRIDHIRDRILSVGAAVSAVDVDRDGWIDLYATNSAFGAPNALYRNRGDGTFEDVAERVGLADLNVPGRGVCMGSIWADVDGDGDEDVFVYRYGATAFFVQGADGRFEERTEAAGLARWVNSNAACWIDYDRDGALDLFVSAYFRSDTDLWRLTTTDVMHDSAEFSSNGGRNLLFRGRGDGTFEDVTEAALPDTSRWTMAVNSADFDGDGWLDLYVANDYGPEELWLNRGGERFELADVGLGHDSKSGMCVALGNLANDGRLAVFVSNISSANWLYHGNNLRVNYVPDVGQMLSEDAGPSVANTGWSWGAAFGDLDNDGWQDLYVVNGFVSGDPDSDYWYRMAQLSGGTGGLLADAANWPPFAGASQSGFERSRLLHNRAGRGFEEIGEPAGIADRFDGRAVVLADLSNRGVLDVVVANQLGPLLLYRNSTPEAPGRGWIQFELTDRAPNTSAIGASVSLDFAKGRQRQVVEGSSGFSAQAPRRLHFGLGDPAPEGPAPVRASVTWPDGTVQDLGTVETGRLHRITRGTRGTRPQ
jgi:hypothetical protein